MTAPDLLTAVGLALYGEQFKVPLACDLGVTLRTVHRWLNGQYAPPPGVWSDLVSICGERQIELIDLRKALVEAFNVRTIPTKELSL